MLRNNNGFTLLETVVGASILFTVILIIVPIASLITVERSILYDRYEYTNQLHLELQPFINNKNNTLPISYQEAHNGVVLSMHMTEEKNNLIKGCVKWENARNEQETACLYGYIKK